MWQLILVPLCENWCGLVLSVEISIWSILWDCGSMDFRFNLCWWDPLTRYMISLLFWKREIYVKYLIQNICLLRIGEDRSHVNLSYFISFMGCVLHCMCRHSSWPITAFFSNNTVMFQLKFMCQPESSRFFKLSLSWMSKNNVLAYIYNSSTNTCTQLHWN